MSKEVGAWLGRRPWRPASGGAPVGAGSPPEVPARWSAARKTEVVLRLLRGDIPDEPLLAAAKAARRRDGLAPSAGPLPTGPSCHYREPIPSRLTHYLTRIIREGSDFGIDTKASAWYKCFVYRHLPTTEALA